MIVIGKEKRFNELQEELGRNGLELVKPTLHKHLKHLTSNNLVIRKDKGVQHVTYEVNHKFFEELGKNLELTNLAKRLSIQQISEFNSKKVDEQVSIVFEKMIIRNLAHLKTSIEFELFTQKRWDRALTLKLLESDEYHLYENFLLDKIKNDRNYGLEMLQKLESLINEIEKNLDYS